MKCLYCKSTLLGRSTKYCDATCRDKDYAARNKYKPEKARRPPIIDTALANQLLVRAW